MALLNDDAMEMHLKDIESNDAAVRRRAFEGILGLGIEAAAARLVRLLVEPGGGDDVGARFALHGLAVHATRPGAEAERAAYAEALAAALDGDLHVAAKRFIIGELQLSGRDEAVPALAKLLASDDLAEGARMALLANPSQKAVEALREALPKAKGRLRVGILHALGLRNDAASVRLLLAEARAADPAARLGAIEALAWIGAPEAEPVIAAGLQEGDERTRRAVVDAYLRLGERLEAAGKRDAARKLYEYLLVKTESPHVRAAAQAGIERAKAARV